MPATSRPEGEGSLAGWHPKTAPRRRIKRTPLFRAIRYLPQAPLFMCYVYAAKLCIELSQSKQYNTGGMDAFLLLARSLVAVVLVIAGLSKMTSNASGPAFLGTSGRLSSLATTALAIAETVVGGALLFAPNLPARLAAVALLLIFFGYTGVQALRATPADCGCFGVLLNEKIGPLTVVRNAILLGSAVVALAEVAPASPTERAVAIAAALGLMLGYAHAVRALNFESLENIPTEVVT